MNKIPTIKIKKKEPIKDKIEGGFGERELIQDKIEGLFDVYITLDHRVVSLVERDEDELQIWRSASLSLLFQKKERWNKCFLFPGFYVIS